MITPFDAYEILYILKYYEKSSICSYGAFYNIFQKYSKLQLNFTGDYGTIWTSVDPACQSIELWNYIRVLYGYCEIMYIINSLKHFNNKPK